MSNTVKYSIRLSSAYFLHNLVLLKEVLDNCEETSNRDCWLSITVIAFKLDH